MKAEIFVEKLTEIGITDLIGVPDSTLKQFCDYVNRDGSGILQHYVPANEGAAVGIATGIYLATGRPSCVYMQNSGLGNTVNPVTSLIRREVYNIPMLFMIGWRGEPGVKDEPQHKYMGEITTALLDVLGMSYAVLDADTTDERLEEILRQAEKELTCGRQFALLVKKGSFSVRDSAGAYKNSYSLVREEVIAQLLGTLKKDDIVVSTTGKISREVYEQSDRILGQHEQEFLTVGGMGHASMIAFGIAQKKRDRKIYCLDGDGAVLMHMGALAFLGQRRPSNMVHICLNNQAHESVGGMPTGATDVSYAEVAKACGYERTYCVEEKEQLETVFKEAAQTDALSFIEVRVAMESREDLGRPREAAEENKKSFMQYHGVKE